MKFAPPSVTILAIALMAASCEAFQSNPHDADLNPKPLELTAAAPAVIGGNNGFGIDLFVRTARQHPENIMLSPLSAHVALTMLMNGSAGETRNQMGNVLGYGADLNFDEVNAAYNSLVEQLNTVDGHVDLTLANAIFYRPDYPVKESFLGTMDSEFDATIRQTDFRLPAAIDEINAWASEQTHGRIPKVLETVKEGTIMILMNALYFKGEWSYTFDRHKTTDAPFRLADGNSVQTPMMFGEVKALKFAGSGYQAVEIPYGRRNFSFIAVLPNGSLDEFYQNFDASDWAEITAGLSGDTWANLTLQMPKFSFASEKDLSKILQDMGMPDAFSAGLADLTPLSDQRPYVDFVKQNTFIDVNEEGTEAAAVTTIGVVETSVRIMTIDRPFVFAIRERTSNTLMFVGHVTDPRN